MRTTFPKMPHNATAQKEKSDWERTRMVYYFEKLPVGSYMLNELYEACDFKHGKGYFQTLLDKYCKSFQPIITKRGTNFYDKK